MKKVLHYLLKAIGMIVFLVLCVLLIRACTSAEMWYVGEHDGQCEIMLNGGDYERDDCGCYQRLVQKDKEREAYYKSQKKF